MARVPGGPGTRSGPQGAVPRAGGILAARAAGLGPHRPEHRTGHYGRRHRKPPGAHGRLLVGDADRVLVTLV